MALDEDGKNVIELAHAFLQGEEYLPGSKLSRLLTESAALEVESIKSSLGSKNGKGWLKALLPTDPRIQLVQIPSVDEPCFSVGGSASPAKLQRQLHPSRTPVAKTHAAVSPPVRPMHALPGPMKGKVFKPASLAGKGMFGKGKPSNLGHVLQPAVPIPRRLPYSAQQASFGHAKQPALPPPRRLMQSAPERRQDSATEFPLPEDAHELIALANDLLQAEEYLPGSKLSKLLQDHAPILAENARLALGGKGWLKRLFAADRSIQLVQVEGVDEPCFAIVVSAARKKLQPVAKAAAAAPKLPARSSTPPPGGKGKLAQGKGTPAPGGKGKPAQGKGTPAPGGKGKPANSEQIVSGKRKLDQNDSMESAKQPRLSTRMTGIPASFPQEEAEAIATAAVDILSQHLEQGFLEGSKLSKSLRELVPSSVNALMQAIEAEFGRGKEGKVGKGWLKMLFAESPMITQVTVERIDEPCFAIAGC